MAEKWKWACICKNEESYIFTAGNKSRPAYIRWGLAGAILLLSTTLAEAQKASPQAQKATTETQKTTPEAAAPPAETTKFSRRKLTFNLFDQNGNQLTDAAIASGKARVFTLREPKTITHSHLTYDRTSKSFTFAESAISPGMILAFVVGNDIMYLSLYGQSPERSIDAIKVQPGSYVLSSNDFAGKKALKVSSWEKFLEDGLAPQQQDLASYRELLKDKKPIELADHVH